MDPNEIERREILSMSAGPYRKVGGSLSGSKIKIRKESEELKEIDPSQP